jgi:hypothetical protein
MMTIKDLSVSKELDREAMTEVRGGLDIDTNNFQFLAQDLNGNGGIGSPTIGIQVAPLISVVTGLEQHFEGVPALPVPAA